MFIFCLFFCFNVERRKKKDIFIKKSKVRKCKILNNLDMKNIFFNLKFKWLQTLGTKTMCLVKNLYYKYFK